MSLRRLATESAPAAGLGDGARGAARLGLLALAVGVAYSLGALLGLSLRFPSTTLAPLWPPNGVLLVALLLTRPRRWWIWLLAAIPAHVAVHAPLGVPPLRQALQIAHNGALALMAALALRRLLGGAPRLDTLREVCIFLATVSAAAALAGAGLSAALSALGMSAGFGLTWRLIACSNLLVFVTLVPTALLTWSHWRDWAERAEGWRMIEAALLTAALLLTSGLVYGRQIGAPDNVPSLVYAPLPLLLWAAVRFGPGGLSLATTTLVLMAVRQVSAGWGPFLGATPTENVISLQAYFLALAAPLMLLAALMAERRRAERDLIALNAELEARVAARTDELAQTNRQLEAARDRAEHTVTRLKHEAAERNRAEAHLRRRVEELEALNRIARALTGWASLSSSLEAVGPLLRELFGAGAVSVWSWDPPGGGLQRVIVVAEGVSCCEPARIGPEAARPLLAGSALTVSEFAADHPLIACPGAAEGGARSYPTLSVTLRAHGELAGLLCVRGALPGQRYLPADMALAQTVGGVLANAVDNARQHAAARAAAAEQERRRLARELHDSVSQALFAADRTAEALPQLWELDPDGAHRALQDLGRFTGSALAEMRALLVELRPAALVDAPLHETLGHLTPALATKEQIVVEAALDQAPLLPPHVQVMLYRIAQEALNNVAKHAGAAHVAISLQVAPPAAPGRAWEGSVTLTVRDDGRGFDEAQVRAGSMGLASLRERAADIGAELEISTGAGAGTQVRVSWRGAAA